jgi:hypothetical protein
MGFHYLVWVVHQRRDLLQRNLTPNHFFFGMLGDGEVQNQQFFTRYRSPVESADCSTRPLQATPSAFFNLLIGSEGFRSDLDNGGKGTQGIIHGF